MRKSYFTSESVTRGHPDKICDQIADRILDELLSQDPESRVACEVTCTTDEVRIFGEVTTQARLDYEETARRVIAEIGYTRPGCGFSAEDCRIAVTLHRQSRDVSRGISRMSQAEYLNMGAGDQGMMFGYACRETEHYMPMPIELAHALAKRLEYVRQVGELGYLLPDGKTQVTVEYDGDRPKRVEAIVLSAQHEAQVDTDMLRDDIVSHVIAPTIPTAMLDGKTQIFINPTGRFASGGPAADAGLTGRKIMVDTYGGYARHGGGSFSGKDATKVDRTGAYMARYMAKNIVAAGLARRCEVQMSYAIGLAAPMSIRVDCSGGPGAETPRFGRLMETMDPRPAAIIQEFGLRRPIFYALSCYGHVGSNAADMPWEDITPARRMTTEGGPEWWEEAAAQRWNG